MDRSVSGSTFPAPACSIMPIAVLSACNMAKTGRLDRIAWNTFDGV